ncbi:MAG: hypothetical protein LQ347_005424 [Umbilicaria vellea]|nr:MAG: hypothetical protein LQ347_005424 [Umbilicaria vellea]
MAAAVGIVGSIISVLQLSAKVVKYLAATKDASVDCQRLLLEIQSVTGLLYMLKERLAGAGSETLPWTHSLDAPEGPVTQFRQALEELVPKLLPAEGWKKVGKTLSWPFKKEEIMAILGRIERQKSLFGLALENDHFALSEALRADVATGCGKTILCSTVIEDIASVYKNGFAYYYFDFNDRAKQDDNNFLRSIIAQLSRGADIFPDLVQKLYDDFERTQIEPSAEILLDTLLTIILRHGHCFLTLDALDESEREGVLAILSRIGSRGLSNLHILVTSRKERDIEVVLAPIVTSIHSLSLDTTDVDADISLYVRQCLATDPKLRRWSDPVKAEIEASLAEGAHGMFRWVECQITALRSCRTEALLRKALKQLPKTLDETYDRILLNIAEEDKQMARSALLWLAFSERPLYLDEVAEAAILSPECCTLDPGDRLLDPHDIIDICSGLITSLPVTTKQRVGRSRIGVKRERELLRFAHFSVKEYILSDRIREGNASAFAILESKAQTFLAQVCISYLLLFHNYELASVEQDRANPMLDYAARFWHIHASSNATLPASTVSQMCSIFRPDQGASFLNWLRIHDPDVHGPDVHGFDVFYVDGFRSDREFSDVASPLYYASLLGLLEVASYLVDGEADIDAECGIWGNALKAAAYGGHASVVSLLLLHGADFEAWGRTTALGAAATGGHESVVQILMTKELDTEANDGRIIVALRLAAFHGHEPIVRLIGTSEACNLSSDDLYDCLLSAFHEGHAPMVQTLLSIGANVNPVEDLRESGVLLQRAARRYTRSFSMGFNNALEAAASSGQVSMMRLLLAQGYDLRTTCNGALQIAAVDGGLATTQFLLSQGADVNARGGRRCWKREQMSMLRVVDLELLCN